MNKISIIGMGYIGFPTALLLADKKRVINCIDISKKKIDNFNKNQISTSEKDIKLLFKKKKKYLSFSNKIEKSDTFIICVPTPIKKISNYYYKEDLRIIESVLKIIEKKIKKNDLIIIESTCPPGFAEKIFKKIRKKTRFFLSTCPERAIPGNTLKEMIYNHRIIGSSCNQAYKKTRLLYKSFVKGKIFKTSLTEAELIKLYENSFRDSNIALANELDSISKNFNINSKKIFELTNLHPRVNIHQPGIGVGGHCIPVDPWFLLKKKNIKKSLIYRSRLLNLNKEKIVYNNLSKKISSFKRKKILCFGITYKENTDDIRNSPALNNIKKLKKKINNLKIFDPLNNSMNNLTSKEVINKKFDEIIVFVKHKWLKKNKLKSKKITYI